MNQQRVIRPTGQLIGIIVQHDIIPHLAASVTAQRVRPRGEIRTPRIGREPESRTRTCIYAQDNNTYKGESVRSGANENAVRSQDGVGRGGNRNFWGDVGRRHRFDHEDVAFSPRFGGGDGANSGFLLVVSWVRRRCRLPDER